MKNLLTAAVFCGLLAGAAGLRAADEPGGEKPKADPEKAFKRLDADKDGKVTKDEFTAKAKDKTKAEARFGRLDKNADGSLTLEEFKADAPKPKKPKTPA